MTHARSGSLLQKHPWEVLGSETHTSSPLEGERERERERESETRKDTVDIVEGGKKEKEGFGKISGVIYKNHGQR